MKLPIGQQHAFECCKVCGSCHCDGRPCPQVKVDTYWKGPGEFSRPGERVEVDQTKHAVAFDKGKPKFSLVPPQWTRWMIDPFQAGIDKGYLPGNWMLSINTEKHDEFREQRLNSLMRHLDDYRMGIYVDKETGVPTLVLIAWNALCIHTYDVAKKELNNVLKANKG